MRKRTVRRKLRRAKTRRGGMNNPPPPYNDLPPYVANHPPSYTNSSSNMGTQSNRASSIPIENQNDDVLNEQPFNFEADGFVHEWIFQGKKVYVDSDGNMWARTDADKVGQWMGKYNPSTKVLDASALEPYYNNSNNEQSNLLHELTLCRKMKDDILKTCREREAYFKKRVDELVKLANKNADEADTLKLQYKSLIDKYNTLADRRDDLIHSFHELMAERNKIAHNYNLLLSRII